MFEYYVVAKIEIIFDSTECIILISNFESLEDLYCLLSLLLKKRIDHLTLLDKTHKKRLQIKVNEENLLNLDEKLLFLTNDIICIILKMIADVIVHNAFSGYHLDIYLHSTDGENVNIDFIFLS